MQFIALGVAALALVSCSISTPPLTTPHQPFETATNDETTPLLVFSHGHHTGLVLPRRAVDHKLPGLTKDMNGEWLEFGWGDEGFYRSEAVTFPLAFRAMAYPTPGVMHVVTDNGPLHHSYAYSPAHLFSLSASQTDTLVERLASQFARNEQGEFIELGPGRYGRSRFYRARDRFYFPKTCNAWTADHLRAIGYEISAITAPGLFRELDKLEGRSHSSIMILPAEKR